MEAEIDDLRAQCRANPKHLPLRLELGDLLLGRGDPRGALEVYREALRLKPSYTKAQRKVREAEALCPEIQKEQACVPYATRAAQAAALRAEGNRQFNLQCFEKAWECYSEAIDILKAEGSGDAKLHTNRAACLLTAERWVPAAFDGVMAIELDPDWWKGYWYHGQGLLGQLKGKRPSRVTQHKAEQALRSLERASQCTAFPEDKQEAAPPLDQEPLNDFFLANFSERCPPPPPPPPHPPPPEADASEDNDDAISEPPEEKPGVVSLSNLPFGSTDGAVRARCEEFGTVLKVESGAAGRAVAIFRNASEADLCRKALDGAMFEGRRLQARDKAPPRRRSGPARYFLKEDADSKGGRRRNPCSYCGREGHLMDACPKTVCERCFEEGHAVQACRKPRDYRPTVVCTACGALGHSWKWCVDAREGHRRLSRGAICLSCGGRDHLVCGSPKLPTTREVYCSWCASEGHTEPSCPVRHTKRRRVSY
ncbi:hypothetical protein CTAYLR_003513 [Chrysophaeum taylorii]|uniref:Uncharacterized protein n=1 Tax=Chrysophaeum taylorii TaxID=2483200 RepID=A0AAD7XNC3_9STRA|nr:hypothetical protein CTAYLR_003513 [Chrysophaeum taylorii]